MVSRSKAAGLVIDPGVLSDIGLSRYFKHNSLTLCNIALHSTQILFNAGEKYRRQCKVEQNTVSVESEGKLNESHLMLAREGFAQLLFSNDYDVDDDGSDDEDGDDSDHSPQFRQIIQLFLDVKNDVLARITEPSKDDLIIAIRQRWE